MALTGALIIFVQVKGKGALLNYWLTGRSAPPSQSQVDAGPAERGARAVRTSVSFSSAPFNRAPGSSAAPPMRSGSFLPQWLGGRGRGGGNPAAMRRPSPPLLLAAKVAPLEAARAVTAFSAGAADAIPDGDWLRQPREVSVSGISPKTLPVPPGPTGPSQAEPQGGVHLLTPPPSGPPVLPPPESRRSPEPGAAALAGDDLELVEVWHS